MLAYIIGLIAGAASPTQASVNGRIRQDFKSAYVTSIVNFISASAVLAVIILAVERNLILPLAKVAEQPLWIWLGGSCGMAIVILNIICLPKLGSARNVMLICFGQIMAGLIIDHFALFGAPQASMSLRRLIGAVLVIIGIALINGVKGESKEGQAPVLYIILAILCGAACSAQVAINGTLKEVAGTALKATLISMIVGLITAIIVTLIVFMMKGRDGLYDGNDPSGRKGFRPWMIIGGSIAIIIVGGNAVVAPVLGTGVVTILNLIGMMAAGLVIDATGFLGIDKKPVTLVKIAGMLLMIAGAAIISLM
ncbi:MAG: DMT family transporter [Mogibacterium sp.]|nr:DMT family transporter [Mogibacterium sp.]